MNMGHLRGMERVRYYSRFRHAKYEVTAPNLSTTKAKQLRGLSLCLPPHWSEVRAHCRNTTMSTSAMIVMHHGTNVRGGSPPAGRRKPVKNAYNVWVTLRYHGSRHCVFA